MKSLKKQKGFALVVALMFMIIFTMIGFGLASRGKISSQIAKSSSRYEAVSVAAESEMYRLLDMVNRNESYIKTGNSVVIEGSEIPKRISQVWSGKELGRDFNATETLGRNSVLPNFSNFNHNGWDLSGVIENDIDSEYGEIKTKSFVEELIAKKVDRSIVAHYLVTVKAYAKNPGDAKGVERETIVIQSLSQIRFIE